MGEVTMRVMPAGEVPSSGAILVVPEDGAPAFRGTGGTNFVCGECGALLAEGVNAHHWTNIFIRCRCGAMNDSAR
jgi:hypothetical protein